MARAVVQVGDKFRLVDPETGVVSTDAEGNALDGGGFASKIDALDKLESLLPAVARAKRKQRTPRAAISGQATRSRLEVALRKSGV